MSSPDHNYCDRCGEKSYWRQFVQTGKRSDSAGGMESDGETIDLCSKCLGKAVLFLLNKTADWDINKLLLKWVKACPK